MARAQTAPPPAGAPSLVDSAEQALHNWLAAGRYRQGDRLPPEHEVAAMLGVSRGTLRSALARLEEAGEIVRRQGSGTFVGRTAVPSALGRAPRSARALLVGRRAPRAAPLVRRREDRAARGRRRRGRGARAGPGRARDDLLAHAAGRRRARRGDVRRRAPADRAARRARAACSARARSHGARRADRVRHPRDLRAHAGDAGAAGPARPRRAVAAGAAHDRPCSSSRS